MVNGGKERSPYVLVSVLSVALLVLLASGGWAAQKGKPPGDTKVTTNMSADGDVSLSTNLRIQNDGTSQYTTFKSGKNSVSSIVQGIGDYVLDVRNSTTRTILVDFREPVPPTLTTSAPFNWDFVNGRIIVRCSLVLSGGLPSISVGSTLNCPMAVSFTAFSANYRINMNPENHSDTNWARVTCGSADAAGKCNSWVIAPWAQDDGTVRSVGKLLLDPSSGPSEDKGNFYMTFKIGVTNP